MKKEKEENISKEEQIINNDDANLDEKSDATEELKLEEKENDKKENKKKKKKKKKKEDPIDILLKLKEQNKELDDETASQYSLSYISQDGAFNDFRKDIKKETKDNKFEKIKPQFSKEFVSNFK